MKTTQENLVTEVNATAIQKINKFLKVNPNEEFERVEMKISFYNYYDLMCNINALFEGIKILSIDSNAPEKDNLSVINSLSAIGAKLLPFSESEFMDYLIFKKSYENSDVFMDIETLQRIKNG